MLLFYEHFSCFRDSSPRGFLAFFKSMLLRVVGRWRGEAVGWGDGGGKKETIKGGVCLWNCRRVQGSEELGVCVCGLCKGGVVLGFCDLGFFIKVFFAKKYMAYLFSVFRSKTEIILEKPKPKTEKPKPKNRNSFGSVWFSVLFAHPYLKGLYFNYFGNVGPQLIIKYSSPPPPMITSLTK